VRGSGVGPLHDCDGTDPPTSAVAEVSGVFRMCERRGPGGLGDVSVPVGSRGKAPVGGLVEEVPRS